MSKEDQIFSSELKIQNSLGLHARPASMFVQLANSYNASITVEKDGESIDGKSLMGLLMLSAGHGTVIKVSTRGEDGELALDAISKLIDDKFDEE